MRYFLYLISFIFFISTESSAQHRSVRNTFVADIVKGCGPMTVTFTRAKASDNTEYGIAYLQKESCYLEFDCLDLNDPSTIGVISNENPSFSHRYSEVGSYTVAVFAFGQAINENNIDYLKIEVLESSQQIPNISFSECSDKKVKLEFPSTKLYTAYEIKTANKIDTLDSTTALEKIIQVQQAGLQNIEIQGLLSNKKKGSCPRKRLQVNIQDRLVAPVIESISPLEKEFKLKLKFKNINKNSYLLEQKSASASDFTSLNSFNTDSYSVKSDAKKSYRIAYDLCSNPKKYSNVLSTVELNGQAKDSSNSLEARVIENDFSTFILYKDGNRIPSSTLPYQDKNIICDQNSVYTLEAINDEGKSSKSLPFSLKAKKSTVLENPPLAYVSHLTNNKIEFFWDKTEKEKVKFYSIESDDFSFQKTENRVEVDLGKIEDAICYKLAYENNCAQKSTHRRACSIWLKKEQKNTTTAKLTWEELGESYETSDFQLSIEKLDRNFQLLESVEITGQNEYAESLENAPASELYYRLKVSNTDNPEQTIYSNALEVSFSPIWEFPNAFSPNGDKVNDLYHFVGTENTIHNYTLEIYNRWGSLIFRNDRSTEFSGWDGKTNNQNVAQGSYTFKASMVDSFGKKHQKSGSILLLR